MISTLYRLLLKLRVRKLKCPGRFDGCGYAFLGKTMGRCVSGEKNLLAGLFDGGCQLAMFEEGLHGAGDGIVARLCVLVLGTDNEAPQILMDFSN